MQAIDYPLKSTSTGDLALASLDSTIGLARARLLLDCRPGDRPLLEGFGSRISQFNPSGDRQVEAEILRGDLDLWCSDGLVVGFAVEPVEREPGRTSLVVRVQ